MIAAAPLALLEHRAHEESSLTAAPTVHDSAGDPVLAHLARRTSAKSRSTLRGALVFGTAELGAADAPTCPHSQKCSFHHLVSRSGACCHENQGFPWDHALDKRPRFSSRTPTFEEIAMTKRQLAVCTAPVLSASILPHGSNKSVVSDPILLVVSGTVQSMVFIIGGIITSRPTEGLYIAGIVALATMGLVSRKLPR